MTRNPPPWLLPSALTAMLLVTPAPAAGQRLEAGAHLGTLAFTPIADTDLASSSVEAAAGATLRVGGRTFIGVDVTVVPFHVPDGEPFYVARTRMLQVSGEVGRRAQPFRRVGVSMVAGAGVQRTSSQLMTQTFSATDPMVHLGGGIDVRLTSRVSVGPDVRYVRSFGFSENASRTDIASHVLPWPSLHQVRATIGVRVLLTP